MTVGGVVDRAARFTADRVVMGFPRLVRHQPRSYDRYELAVCYA
jgi:hypothetical protein